jgi:hypothetical protein
MTHQQANDILALLCHSSVWEDEMLAYTYPLLSLFVTMLIFFGFVIWIWLLIVVFGDIFRSHDIGGFAKALWVLLVIFLPLLGVLIYLIARGGKMQERAARGAQQQQQEFDSYVQEVAGSETNSADQLAKLAQLREQGVITEQEFQAQKAKALA